MILPPRFRRSAPPLLNRQRGVLGLPQFRGALASGGGGGSSVVFLNHCEGADLATTAVSTIGPNLTQSISGARVSTTQSRFGSSSIYCDSSGAMAVAGLDAARAPGLQDFVWEGWTRPDNGAASFGTILDCRPSGSDGYYPALLINASQWHYYLNGNFVISGGSTSSATWWYWAIARTSGVTRLYAGTSGTASLCGSITDTNNYSGAQGISVMNVASGGVGLAGYTDELRMQIGTGGGFTGSTIPVPTAAFT